MDIPKIQEYLKEHELDGWLLADFHARNNIAMDMLRISGIVSRRSFYFIPADGEPVGLVNIIEKSKFQHLPGKIIPYFGYKDLERRLKATIEGHKRLAMEYSPMGRLPYIGLVDAGTVEMVRECGIGVAMGNAIDEVDALVTEVLVQRGEDIELAHQVDLSRHHQQIDVAALRGVVHAGAEQVHGSVRIGRANGPDDGLSFRIAEAHGGGCGMGAIGRTTAK